MKIMANEMDYQEINQIVRNCDENIQIENCCGERFIGLGAEGKTISVTGTPGNALGAYLNGGVIRVSGNVQDAVGDTMNSGQIIIDGNAGDALGYAMRGGEIYVRGSSGYRTGIHMKEYGSKRPVIVIGGTAGSFLGEYLAGGMIIVLNLEAVPIPLGNFTGTGMHGGAIYVHSKVPLKNLPEQVAQRKADENDLKEIAHYFRQYCDLFGGTAINPVNFYKLTPNAKNPYKRLYTLN